MSECLIPRLFQLGDIDLSNAEILTGAIVFERDQHSTNRRTINYNLAGGYSSFIFYRTLSGYPSTEYVDPLEFDYLQCYHISDIEFQMNPDDEIEKNIGYVNDVYRIIDNKLELIYQKVASRFMTSDVTPLTKISYDPEVNMDNTSDTSPGFRFDLNYDNSLYSNRITIATLIKMNK